MSIRVFPRRLLGLATLGYLFLTACSYGTGATIKLDISELSATNVIELVAAISNRMGYSQTVFADASGNRYTSITPDTVSGFFSHEDYWDSSHRIGIYVDVETTRGTADVTFVVSRSKRFNEAEILEYRRFVTTVRNEFGTERTVAARESSRGQMLL